jgi:pseudouridine kinase
VRIKLRRYYTLTEIKQSQPSLLIAGALHLDELATLQSAPIMHASNPVNWCKSVGGVAANAAVSAARVESRVTVRDRRRLILAAAVGTDSSALSLVGGLRDQNVEVHEQRIENASTGRYSAILDCQGELFLGLADVALAEQLEADHILDLMTALQPEAILVDTNLSQYCLNRVVQACKLNQLAVSAIAVSPIKARKLSAIAQDVAILFCNRQEALTLVDRSPAAETKQHESNLPLDHLADGLLSVGFNQFVITDGAQDLITQDRHGRTQIPVPAVSQTQSVNGAGDAMAGAVFNMHARGMTLESAVKQYGLPAAAEIVSGTRRPVSPGNSG